MPFLLNFIFVWARPRFERHCEDWSNLYFIWSELSSCICHCNTRFRLYLFASHRGYRLNRGWGSNCLVIWLFEKSTIKRLTELTNNQINAQRLNSSITALRAQLPTGSLTDEERTRFRAIDVNNNVLMSKVMREDQRQISSKTANF